MSTKLCDIEVAAATDEFLILFLKGTDKLQLFFEAFYTTSTTTTGVEVTLYNGYGPRHASIPYPYTQAVPFFQDAEGVVSGIMFDGEGTTYSLSPTASDYQSGSITVDMKSTGDYLKIRLNNTDTVKAVMDAWVKV